jgi:hypothetical protein
MLPLFCQRRQQPVGVSSHQTHQRQLRNLDSVLI